MTLNIDRQGHIELLAIRIGCALDGERIDDGVYACASIIAYGLKDSVEEDREDDLQKIIEFIRICMTMEDA
jgi:hypothetical protein